MKYQQLENLESGWKWKYLVKKHREGELITRYLETSAAKEAVDLLLKLEYEPVRVNDWIAQHMNDNVKARPALIDCLAPDRRVEIEVKGIKDVVTQPQA